MTERTINATVRARLEAPETPDALLAFLTIAHPGLSEPIRVVSDVMDYTVAGKTFTGMPFDYQILSDSESAPQTELRMQNVDRRIGQALRQIKERAKLRLEIRSSADFDLAQDPRTETGTSTIYAFDQFELVDVSVDSAEITGRVMLRDYAQEAWAFAPRNPLPGAVPMTAPSVTAGATWPSDWLARYVGLPFGTGPGEVTCWSLVCRFYADEMGIDLPAFGDIDPTDLVRVAREMKRGEDMLCWREPGSPVTGDVVLMRSARGGRAICHVGILADCRRVLHAEEDTGSVIVPVDHFTIRNRVAGFRRYVLR